MIFSSGICEIAFFHVGLKTFINHMKKLALFIILFYSCVPSASAQDIITLKSGEELKAHIVKLNPNDVRFIPENSNDTIYLLRDDVSTLRYRSGIIIHLTDNEKSFPVENFEGTGDDSLFQLGAYDASRYYKGYKAAAIGTMIGSIYFPLGLIPAIACSSTPPRLDNLNYRNPQLMENSAYYNGYTGKAHKIKKQKVWQGFAIGSGIFFVLVIISTSLATTY
jgi:hypothetical protein